MEKVLELYKYVDGVNDTPFPSSGDGQLRSRSFRYDAKRMGGAPTITLTAMYPSCLDNEWDKNVYASFNGERYYLKQTPTSSYSNEDTRYKHEVELVSERMILDNIYFYDVVQENTDVDKPVSNSSKFAFFGDIEEYVARLNSSLSWSNVDYHVVIDDGIFSEEKQVSFENQVITVALQEIYNIYQIPYYFVGKTIHVGVYQESIEHLFKYGIENSLLSITKDNANAKIINRITGVGSSDNIPYYYPNDDEKGVTRPLLNGSKDGVKIIDASKYRKVRLSDRFNFSGSLQTSTPLIDENKYTLGDLRYESSKDGKGQYSLDFYYSFTLNQQDDVFFGVNSLYENNVDLRYEVYKTSGQHFGYFTGVNTLSLTGGTYNFIIRWKFLYEGSLMSLEDNLPMILEHYFHAFANVVVDAQNTWTLKGIPVSLSNYGLSVQNPSDGDVLSIEQISYINTQPSLMPPIYRSTSGDERFYNAQNNTYKDKNGNYYTFDNEYSNINPREHIENFDDIRPTIKNVTNSEGDYIDRFIDFAYDLYDNDDVDEEGKYIHKYFYAKLNKFDGENGFNLFDHAIDESEMVISMTSGSCGSCSFKIMVNKDTKKNTVQVDEYGNLLRDSDGNVRFGSPQDKQNDTINNQVWIALEKDAQTFGILMPNASKQYRPIAGDTFVILHIDLPKAYITAAEKRLEDELIKYMHENNFEKFNFSISFSRIFFEEHPEILQKLSENSKLQVEYNGTTYVLYVSSLSYSMTTDKPLPEIKVELDDAITISQNQINKIVESTKKELISSVNKDVFWVDIKGIPSWITSEKPKYSYSELSGSASQSDGLWVVKTDANGQSYLYTTYPVATQLGITTFASNEKVDIEGIYDGLPIDNQTLYWELDENGKKTVLKAKGGGEGTLAGIEITGEGNAITDVTPSSDGTKLVFSKGLTFVDKSYLDENFHTKTYIADTFYTKQYIEDVFFKKDDATDLFVTLDETEQEILGIKVFKEGIKIGNSRIHQSQDGVLFLDGHLVVSGSVTMYGDNGDIDIPTIWAGLPIDENTLVRNEEGVLMVNPNIELGGASSWDEITGKPEWITDTKPSYTYSEISGTPDLSVYASKDDLKGYVSLTGTESVEGIKDFVNGIAIDGLSIYKSQDDVVYVDANLVVRGAVVMYGDAIADIPSFMESLLLDENTLTLNEEGRLTVIGGTGGGSIEYPLSWSGYSSGSYDGSVAKSIYIPSKVSELTNDSSFITSSALSGYATETWVNNKGYLTSSSLNGYATQSWVTGQGYATSAALGGYLPLTGGALTGSLWIDGDRAFMPMDTNGYGLYFAGLNINIHKNHSYQAPFIGSDANGNLQFAKHPTISGSPIATQGWVSGAYLPKSGGTITGDLTISGKTLYVDTIRGTGNYWIMGGGASGNISFGGYYAGCTTSLNGDTIKVVAGNFEKMLIQKGALYIRQDQWANGLRLERTVANSGAAISIYSNSTYLGYFGINGSSVFELGYASTGVKFTVDSSGNGLFYGGITQYSDERKKTIINHVQLSLREIADAPLIEHYYNSDERKTTHVGSIAQYWAGLNDWFCKQDDDGYYTMEIQNAALASAISIARELAKYETKTDKQIRRLKKRISELEDEIEKLKTA